jgi:hypothetical protein
MTTRKHVFCGILALVSLLGLGITQSARANFIATIDQVGPNVVVTGSGTIDLTGLSFLFGGTATPSISPNTGSLSVGPSASVDAYSAISGPASFGTGGFTFANGGSGDVVGLQGLLLLVPQGYFSGNPLSGTATYDNATFASLGITPGTYTWTWGTGVDSFMLQIGPTGVPDAGSTLGLYL